jgi:hypothetical protein
MLENHLRKELGSTKAILYLPFKKNNKAITLQFFCKSEFSVASQNHLVKNGIQC